MLNDYLHFVRNGGGMDQMDGLRAFVATAQTGSFTQAAARLGVSNRLTSKYVAALEDRLGVRLLQRTTRRVGLTPAGEALLARAPALLDEFDDMLGAVAEETRGYAGVLRVSAPVTFGEVYVADMLRRFAAPHPELLVDLRLSDAYVDLAAGGIDIAYRIGTPDVSALRQRRLGQLHSRVVAAPTYLADAPPLATPDDLGDHICIVDTNRRAQARWEFVDPASKVTTTTEVRGRFQVNSARVARDLAIAGQGVAFCPDFVVDQDIAAGRLVPLLDAYDCPAIPISLVYLQGRRLPRKLRALIDFVVADARASGLA